MKIIAVYTDLHISTYDICCGDTEKNETQYINNIDKENLALEILNAYVANAADKIVLMGNDLLTYHLAQQIQEQNTLNYNINNLIIERPEEVGGKYYS